MTSNRPRLSDPFVTVAARVALSLASSLAAFGCSAEDDTPQKSAQEDVARIEQSIVLPSGFQHQVVASGFSDPTAMAVAPDGRIFIAQKTGAVRVVKNGALLATPFVSLTVDNQGERGLVGIALDPSFASNGYVYVFYNTSSGGLHNRVSRFTANGDVAATGSESVLVEFPALTATIHVSGALHFGQDGKLYVAHGDNDSQARAQDLNHPFGKILAFQSRREHSH